jgi:hypothetical protein
VLTVAHLERVIPDSHEYSVVAHPFREWKDGGVREPVSNQRPFGDGLPVGGVTKTKAALKTSPGPLRVLLALAPLHSLFQLPLDFRFLTLEMLHPPVVVIPGHLTRQITSRKLTGLLSILRYQLVFPSELPAEFLNGIAYRPHRKSSTVDKGTHRRFYG